MSVRRVARPAALRSIPIDRHAVIEASAGTGKTFTLENLVIELLLTTDVTLDRILIVTFTEKATNELRLRLRAQLQDLVSDRHEAMGTLERAGNDFWVIDEVACEKLQRALRTFDAATIATIHAFCQRVLRENAFASARMFQEQQVDGRYAFGRAMREALRRDIARDARRAGWLEAALHAGWSIQRIEELAWDCLQSRGDLRPVLDEVALERILEAFPLEHARRTSNVSEMRSWGMHASTARTVASRLYELAHVVERARDTRSIPIYALEVQEIDFPYLLDKLLAFQSHAGPAGRLCAAAVELGRCTPTFAAGLAQMILPPVCTGLARHKRETGQYDFDDMLTLVDRALEGGPTALSTALRERWRYVLIDEFQDTDETQWSIFRRAFFEGAQSSVLYLVGDPKQSIYRFRGADVETYLRACAEVIEHGGERVQLDHNYRATAALVEATNAIFDQSSENPIFTGSISYSPIHCGRAERTLVDGKGLELSPVSVLCISPAGDASWLSTLGQRIAREVLTLTDPSSPWRLDGRPLACGDVFVLTRNAREGRTIGAALRATGVPHAYFKQDGLFQTDEAKEVRTLLLAIEQPNDRARRLAAWLTPFFGLPLADIGRVRDTPDAHPLVARLEQWKALAEDRDFDGLFESVLRDSGIVRREIFFADGERELTNYLHVFEQLLELAHSSPSTVRDLASALSGLIDGTRMPLEIEGNVQRLADGRSAVQIMTIHKSKGLEAPVVFVAGGFQQGRSDSVRIFHEHGRRLAWVGPVSDPEVERKARGEEREEEQRLMYVALTRAKGRLYLPCILASPGGPARSEPKALRGPYGLVNRRIWELVRTGEPTLSIEDSSASRESEDRLAVVAPREPWRPPAELVREDDERATMVDLRESRAASIVTSYTRMKGERSARPLPSGGVSERVADSVAETELRAARTSGIFLHEVLERVPLVSFAAKSTFDSWRSQSDVHSLFDEAVATHRIDGSQRQHAEELVWIAYTTPLRLPSGKRLDAIFTARRVVREMGFVFSMKDHDDVAQAKTPTFVRGSLDLAFDDDDLVYFVDWKSDRLASYASDAIERHVNANYSAQAQLYAIAISKLLGIRTAQEHEARFGGMFYCFLRGLDAYGHGVWSARPNWDQVLAWEGALREA